MRASMIAKSVAVAGAAVTALSFSQATASAGVLDKPTPESVSTLQHQLENEGVQPVESTSGGVLKKSYTADTPTAPRVVITTTEPAPVAPGAPVPELRAGVGNGLYLYLNRTDQSALIYGGSAALGTALCGIPVVGQFGCAGIAGALAAGATYLSANGICGNELEINIGRYFDPTPRFKCV